MREGSSRINTPDLACLRQAPPSHFKTDEILSEIRFTHLFNQHFAASSDQTGVTAN